MDAPSPLDHLGDAGKLGSVILSVFVNGFERVESKPPRGFRRMLHVCTVHGRTLHTRQSCTLGSLPVGIPVSIRQTLTSFIRRTRIWPRLSRGAGVGSGENQFANRAPLAPVSARAGRTKGRVSENDRSEGVNVARRSIGSGVACGVGSAREIAGEHHGL